MTGVIDIGYLGLLLSLVFVFFAGLSSVLLGLGLQRDIAWGTVRTVSQLYLMGYILVYIFRIGSPVLVLGVFAGMVLFAGRIISGRVSSGGIPFLAPTITSMLLSYTAVTIIVTSTIIGVDPWYDPKYFIPIGGMIIGNSMNAVAISLERFFSDLSGRRDVVEMYLSLGADYREASAEAVRKAISSGMIPSINSMMGAGLVFLPGMMTGQILAGADPIVAIKYQIMVMLMLVGSTALGSILVVFWVRRKAFSPDDRLLVRALEERRGR